MGLTNFGNCECYVLTFITIINNFRNFSFLGGLPHAWSSPCLGPGLRAGLKPPLLQQAAFDELVFRVDVMRNVATRENTETNLKINKWSSMPAIPLNSISSQEEEIQEVAGRLEIRVVPKETTNEEIISAPVKITNEISTKPIRDRKTELIEQEIKAISTSNPGSKESITENTVHKPSEIVNEITNNIVQTLDTLPSLDKQLEQLHCVLNVEKYEINHEKPNDLINNEEKILVDNNIGSPLKLVNEMSAKESLVTNEKDVEEEAKNEVNEIVDKKVIENNVKAKRDEVRKCSPCIDLTSHPSVTFVPANSHSQPEIPR